MRRQFPKLTLPLLLSVLLLAGLCWQFADPLLDSLVRPALEAYAGQRLDAQVKIERLVVTPRGLDLLELRLAKADVHLSAARLALEFTLSDLWKKRFTSLRISSPRLELRSGMSQDGNGPHLTLPAKAPFTIDRLQIQDGSLLFATGSKQWQIHTINLSGSLQQQSPFHLSAFIGPSQQHPVDLSGVFDLSQPPTLVLEHFSWQKEQLLEEPLKISLAGSDLLAEGSRLHLAQVDQRRLEAVLTALKLDSPLPAELEFSLADLHIALLPQQQGLQVALRADKAEFSYQAFKGDFAALQLTAGRGEDVWTFAGDLQGPANSHVRLSAQQDKAGDWRGEIAAEAPAAAQLKTELFGGEVLPISGGLELSAQFSRAGKALQTEFNFQGLPPMNAAAANQLNIAPLSGQGTFVRNGQAQEFTAGLLLAQQPFLNLNGTSDRLAVELKKTDLRALVPLLTSAQLPEPLHAAEGLSASGEFRRVDGQWQGPFRISLASLPFAGLEVHEVSSRGTLHFSRQHVSFREFSLTAAIRRGEELSARLQAQGRAELDPELQSLILQDLTLKQLNYVSADGQAGIGEGMLNLQGEVRNLGEGQPLELKLGGSLTAREVLSGAFYADLSAYRADYSFSGRLSPATKTLQADSLQLSVPQIGSLTASGTLTEDDGRLQISLRSKPLDSSYADHLAPLLQNIKPLFAELSFAGELTAAADLHWRPSGWQCRGHLRLDGLDASWKKGRIRLLQASGSIPFDLVSQATSLGEISPDILRGELNIAHLAIPLASLEQAQLLLEAEPNRLAIRSPLQLRLAGGRASVEGLELDWPAGQIQGAARVNISDLELAALTKGLDWPAMQGQFSADLGTLRYAAGQLSSEGLASIKVFGGMIQLRNMRYTEPFSRYPKFSLDIDFSGIDLLQATRTYDFGEINGILDGYVHGLQLSGTTPAAFVAKAETRPEGTRNISVKALKNLSILSQGGFSAALSRGIYQFIDFYRYRKLGIKCALENDTFTLVGTAMPDSNRYLVRGALLPPRIDITTATPTISFKEMLNRLGRIERAGN